MAPERQCGHQVPGRGRMTLHDGPDEGLHPNRGRRPRTALGLTAPVDSLGRGKGPRADLAGPRPPFPPRVRRRDWYGSEWVLSCSPAVLSIDNILIIGFLILSLGIHEAAHAWVAYLRGDSTARDMGRMTLNPIAHIDPIMTIALPVILIVSGSGFLFGGAKPVPVNFYNLRKPQRDMMLVAIAGPISNFLLAILFLTIRKVLLTNVGMDRTELAPVVMFNACYVNLILAIFNLIPVPPLDGSRVMAWILPSGMRESYVALERFGLLIVFGLLMLGVLNTVLMATIRPMYDAVDFLTGGVW